jgi:hypothetical protein
MTISNKLAYYVLREHYKLMLKMISTMPPYLVRDEIHMLGLKTKGRLK